MEMQEQNADGKLISGKISEEIEHDTVQSFDEIDTYLQNILISTNWHSYNILQERFFQPVLLIVAQSLWMTWIDQVCCPPRRIAWRVTWYKTSSK